MSQVTSAGPVGRPMPPASSNPAPVASAPHTAPVAPPVPTPPAPSAVAPAASAVPSGVPSASGAPAPSTEPKKRRGRKPQSEENRVHYPGLQIGEDGNAKNKIEKVPSDFDPEKHLPLRGRDFVDSASFLEYKAERYEKEAKECREQAAELRQLGGKERQAQAKKLEKALAAIAEVENDFTASGLDYQAIVAKMKAKIEAKASAQPAAPAAG